MKKLIILPLLLGAVMLCSLNCGKNSDFPARTDKQADQVISNSNFQEKIQEYGLLNKQEKYTLWQAHLEKAKAQFFNNHEPEKLALTDELLQGLTVDAFDVNTTAYDVLNNFILPVWADKAKAVFNDQEMYDLTFDPNADIIQRTAPGDIGSFPEGGAKCFCHVGMSGFICRKVVLSLSPSIQNGICERTSADCEGSNSGCGWLWLQSCYGNHCNF